MAARRGEWERGEGSPLIIDGDELPAKHELLRLLHAGRARQSLPVELPPAASLPWPRRLVLASIRFYQQQISTRLNRRCLLEPSCSRYAEFAVAHQGVLAGSVATWRRLRRCTPENEGRIDYPKGVSIAVPDSQHRSGLQ